MKLKILKGDASFLLLILIILLIAFGIAFSIYTFRSNPVEDALAANCVINILFVLEQDKTPVSTYVLMYYPVTQRAAVFDVPGNLGLLLSKINRVDRIDKVYDSARIGAYESEIEKILDIDISFSIVVTKENLVSIVDLLEGVEIFIPSPVSQVDDEIILFPSGMTILDGDKAAVYATFELIDEESEVTTVRRQRFFQSFLHRQNQMNERLNNPSMAKMYFSYFKSNMNQHTLRLLFNEFVHIDIDRINIQSVGGTNREVSGQRLIIPLWDGSFIKEVVRQTLGTLTRDVEAHYAERSLTVEILNGTAVTGLAGRTADMLRNLGYDVISTANADRNNYDDTLIIQRSRDDNLVREFADLIRCKNIRNEIMTVEELSDLTNIEYKADLTLILGRNFNGRHVTGN